MRLDLLHPSTAMILRHIWRRELPGWPEKGALTEEVFLGDLEAQGMSALLWYQLSQLGGKPDWPAQVLQSLHERAVREAAVEMLWERQTRIVLAALADKNIEPLLLKGAALSLCLYPQAGLRPRCDTDLLVPEYAKDAAQSVMRSLGYRPLYEAAVPCISGQMTWVKPGKEGIAYSHDLHWRIRNNHRTFSQAFDHARLYPGSVALPQMGEYARTLNAADALLLACVHRAGHFSHAGDRLIWLYDIHLLSEALTEAEVEGFCAGARKLDLEILCGDAFDVTHSWFGTGLPRKLDAMREKSGRHGKTSSSLPAVPADGIRHAVQRELRNMTWIEAMKYLLQNAFPPPNYMKWRYARDNRRVLPWLYLKRLIQGVSIFVRK